MSDSVARDLALDPHQSFIVQAPAGSGKTELLTQRFLRLLSHVEQAPEEILAVTFTRKAASEMRQRILERLQFAHYTHEAPKLEHQRKTWQLAKKVLERDNQLKWHLIQNPNRLKIVTIDALCTSIVKKMPILSQMGSAPEIDQNPQRLYENAIKALLTQTTLDEPWSKALQKLLIHLDNKLEVIQGLLVNLLGKRDQWLPYLNNMRSSTQEISQYLNECIAKIIVSHLKKLRAQFPQELIEPMLHVFQYAAKECVENGNDSIIARLVNINALPNDELSSFDIWEGIAELLLTQKNEWRKKFDLRIGFPSPSSCKDKTQSFIRKQAKENMQAIMETLSSHDALLDALAELRVLPISELSMQQVELLNALGELFPALVAYLQLEFQQTSKVDFIELNLRALEALGQEFSPSDIALGLDYKLHHILIDEYQDTSVTQYRLFEKLVMGWQPNDGKTVFLVGDPMQSIYRFRGAEVSLFLRTQRYGLGQIALTPLTLTMNFRSNDKIINWVNQAFTGIFPQKDDPMLGSVSYSSAQSAITDNAQEEVIHYYWSLPNQSPKCIIEIINEKMQKEPDGHIAILVRAKKHLSHLIEQLKQTNIPFIAHEVEHLEHRTHIVDLMALTRAMSDWSDTLSWYSVLRAPWLGLSLSDLLVLAKQKQDLLWIALSQYTDFESELSLDAQIKLKRCVPIIRHWLDNRGRHRFSQWIRGLWIALGGPVCYQQPDFMRDIEQTLKLIEQFAPNGEWFQLDEVEAKLSELYADIQASCLTTNENKGKVELMTIHKAKGLEFDTVILPHLHSKSIMHDDELLLWFERTHDQKIDLILAPKRNFKDEYDPLYRYVASQIRKKSEFEAMRLLYVGVTRAKKALYFVSESEEGLEKGPPTGSFLALLWPFVKEKAILFDSNVHSFETESISKMRSITRLTSDWTYPLAIENRIRHHIENESQVPNPYNEKQDKFRYLGIVLHRILECLSNESLEDDSAFSIIQNACDILLRRFGFVHSNLQEGRDLIMTAIKNMLADPKGRWLLSPLHTEIQREWHLSRKSSKGIENYVIDYAFVDEFDTRWIIDYKLTQHTQLNDNELQIEINKYRDQLITYRDLVQNLENRSIRCALYFPLSQTWAELTERIENVETIAS